MLLSVRWATTCSLWIAGSIVTVINLAMPFILPLRLLLPLFGALNKLVSCSSRESKSGETDELSSNERSLTFIRSSLSTSV